MKRYRYNLDRFEDQVKVEVRDEEEALNHVLSSTHLQGAQALLEDVYRGSGEMQENLNQLMQMTRDTIDGIGNATSSVVIEGDGKNKKQQVDVSTVKLDNKIFKSLESTTSAVDQLTKDIDKLIQESQDFIQNFEDQYGA